MMDKIWFERVIVYRMLKEDRKLIMIFSPTALPDFDCHRRKKGAISPS